ncbi:branched-chain amino acid aminotransferase [Mesobacillus subterraneus]|uniref:Branched-chain amino acid aminotransferase n=2 Tax=Mesobacillus subterraneus TaxID=285983 RepID=A0A3R9FEN4_9BACI|nr:branched-chain amino acid aminotransferase [Mesobacillus subterraneus]
MERYFQKKLSENKDSIELYYEEKEYALKHDLIDVDLISIRELPSENRFRNAYIERGNKETEEFLSQEEDDFLKHKISYFDEHKNEFIYIESEWWSIVGIDGVAFEKDDVFGNYDVMLGLKLQKKQDSAIRRFLSDNLKGEQATYDLMFDGNEGVWSLNFALNDLEDFNEELTIDEAFRIIYSFLIKLAETIEGLQ